MKQITIITGCVLMLWQAAAQKIDRKALVQRHNVHNTRFDSLSSVTVGNGAFAYTVDVTGLQTFPQAYANGVCLGTQSEWGWHSYPNPNNYCFEEALKTYHFNGRDVTYGVQNNTTERSKAATDFARQNPHRLQLGNLGFDIRLKNGQPARLEDIKDIDQTLDMWTGEIRSAFTVEGVRVQVSTVAHPKLDEIAVKVISDLLKEKRLAVSLRFPYPTGVFLDGGTLYQENAHQSAIVGKVNAENVTIEHQLDTTSYRAYFSFSKGTGVTQKAAHYFVLQPRTNENTFVFTCTFVPGKKAEAYAADYDLTLQQSSGMWYNYWAKGAAVDFTGSIDKRAAELERRIILSQYLLRVQEAGTAPPQETGLTYNSWFGRPHLEMPWWHSVQYALWNRTELLEKMMQWYSKPVVLANARALAKRQGYEGARWQKMTDPDGTEGPSSIGAFLIWQQPHYIYFAELCYRDKPSAVTLSKYRDLVLETADFMASYAYYDSATHCYILGKGLIPAQETFKAEETFNPSFELTYWTWALQTAQEWRVRSGMPRNKKYDEVLQHLSPLPQKDGVYYPTESAADAYANPKYRTDHPIVLGNMGMLAPVKDIDTAVMRKTFDWVWQNWNWPETWGWDFPLTAMAATRLGMPDKAVDALLMNITTNTYLPNGHNYQDGRLRIYLPGNGGLLSAVAMMCAGFDGNHTLAPGIPKNGQWKVRWEGLKKMP
ncbi:hypothetical protein SAMN05421788_101309 [Filimonas lacunae]|uniref:Glycosyl hydrolase family 65, N-terminal domain n=1 Tax=Filimonas lacunae TaxID=477680 RepID=A0A173MMZ6_9BACT|nr:hypothetical protein [Filimonas lacunae]BAV08857.1 polygalacturonase [Filimonas lacunae]SIS62880.1 hypothetical protein SAMN05421788_101309 [Filimonas lacunae]